VINDFSWAFGLDAWFCGSAPEGDAFSIMGIESDESLAPLFDKRGPFASEAHQRTIKSIGLRLASCLDAVRGNRTQLPSHRRLDARVPDTRRTSAHHCPAI
jgi:hypothetical protein